jgi:hypothetical protein
VRPDPSRRRYRDAIRRIPEPSVDMTDPDSPGFAERSKVRTVNVAGLRVETIGAPLP